VPGGPGNSVKKRWGGGIKTTSSGDKLPQKKKKCRKKKKKKSPGKNHKRGGLSDPARGFYPGRGLRKRGRRKMKQGCGKGRREKKMQVEKRRTKKKTGKRRVLKGEALEGIPFKPQGGVWEKNVGGCIKRGDTVNSGHESEGENAHRESSHRKKVQARGKDPKKKGGGGGKKIIEKRGRKDPDYCRKWSGTRAVPKP